MGEFPHKTSSHTFSILLILHGVAGSLGTGGTRQGTTKSTFNPTGKQNQQEQNEQSTLDEQSL